MEYYELPFIKDEESRSELIRSREYNNIPPFRNLTKKERNLIIRTNYSSDLMDDFVLTDKEHDDIISRDSKSLVLLEDGIQRLSEENSLNMICSYPINSPTHSRVALLSYYNIRQTERVCLSAIDANAENMKYVMDQNEEFCLKAVDINPRCFQYIRSPTYEVCKAAVTKNLYNITFVEDQREELCLIAAADDEAFCMIRNQSREVCIRAVNENLIAFRYIHDKNADFITEILEDHPDAVEYIYDKEDATEKVVSFVLNRIKTETRMILLTTLVKFLIRLGINVDYWVYEKLILYWDRVNKNMGAFLWASIPDKLLIGSPLELLYKMKETELNL